MLKPTAVIVEREPDPEWGDPGGFSVEFHWTSVDVDRPHTYSISCGKNRRLAERLAAATESGRVFVVDGIKTDASGQTYVAATCQVMGKYLNADLKKLGF